MKIVTALAFLLFYSFSFSKNIPQDYSDIQTDSIITKSIKELQQLTKENLYQDIDKARVYATAYLHKVQKEEINKYVFNAYYFLFMVEKKAGNYELAYSHIKETIAHYKNNKPSTFLRFLFKKGELESLLVLNEEAINTFSKALDISYEIKDTLSQAFISDNIAILKLDMGAYFEIDAIEKTFKKNQAYYIKKYTETKRDNVLIAAVKSSSYLGLIHIYKEAYANAIQIYQQALDTCNKHGFNEKKVVFLIGLGNAYTRFNRNISDNELALAYLADAEKIADTYHQKEYVPIISLLRGRALYNQGKYQKAIDVLLEIEKNPLPNAKDFEIQEFLSILTDCYLKLQDSKNAKLRLNQFNEVRKNNEQQKTRLANRVFQHIDLKEAAKKIEELEKTVAAGKNKSFLLTLLVLILVVLVLVVIFFFRRRQRIYKERFKKLIAATKSELKQEHTKTTHHSISDKKVHEILEKLTAFEQKKLFRNNKYTLSSIAKKLNTNSTYLSKIINTHKQQTFTEYITELRINDIVERLQEDAKLRSFTMQSIAEEAGFRKAQSFSKAFRNHTGIYPSFFIKQIDNQSNTH